MGAKKIQRAVEKQLDEFGEEDVFAEYLKERSVTRLLNSIEPRTGKVSRGMFYAWLHSKSHPERFRRWQINKHIVAHDLAEESLIISDKSAEDPSSVPSARLQVETRRWLAERYDRDSFGKQPDQTLVGVSFSSEFLSSLKQVEAEIKEAEYEVVEEPKYEVLDHKNSENEQIEGKTTSSEAAEGLNSE